MADSPPDLVLSGVNDGPNVGEDVTYSGTIAAAMEATLLGAPAIAFSQAYGVGRKHHWATAEQWGGRLLHTLVGSGWPERVLINVNFPDLAPADVRGIRVARQGLHEIADTLEERIDPRGAPYYWIGATPREAGAGQRGTDMVANRRGLRLRHPAAHGPHAQADPAMAAEGHRHERRYPPGPPGPDARGRGPARLPVRRGGLRARVGRPRQRGAGDGRRRGRRPAGESGTARAARAAGGVAGGGDLVRSGPAVPAYEARATGDGRARRHRHRHRPPPWRGGGSDHRAQRADLSRPAAGGHGPAPSRGRVSPRGAERPASGEGDSRRLAGRRASRGRDSHRSAG